mgnify:CR=1 FL=1
MAIRALRPCFKSRGGEATKDGDAWRVRWVDGSESANVCFDARTAADRPGIEWVTLEDPRARSVISELPRVLITGGAGTGKTVLALDKAVRLAGGGERVLYLCYNRLLGLQANRHASTNGGGGTLEAWSIHAWFDKVIDEERRHVAVLSSAKKC